MSLSCLFFQLKRFQLCHLWNNFENSVFAEWIEKINCIEHMKMALLGIFFNYNSNTRISLNLFYFILVLVSKLIKNFINILNKGFLRKNAFQFLFFNFQNGFPFFFFAQFSMILLNTWIIMFVCFSMHCWSPKMQYPEGGIQFKWNLHHAFAAMRYADD